MLFRSPETIQGQQLLGHELAHVVQQRAGRARNPLGSGLAVVQDRALEAEADRPLWKAVVLSGAMDPVRSPEMRRAEEVACALLTEILKEGQSRGEVSKKFPLTHLAQFMEGLYRTIVRGWAVDFSGPHSLRERVRSAVDFFLQAAEA